MKTAGTPWTCLLYTSPGNVLRGSYTLVGEAGIEILLEGGEERFSGTYAIASGELVLILSGERQYFSRYRG